MDRYRFWRVVGFFVWRGFYYGGFCGALAGSLVIPVAGTLVGAGWGMIAGLCLGFTLGIITGVAGCTAVQRQWQMYAYHRIIVALSGIFATIAAPFLIYKMGESILQIPVPVSEEASLITLEFIYLILALTAFWAGLASAYTAQLFQNRLHDQTFYERDFFFETEGSEGTVAFWMTHLFMWWQLHLIIGIGIVWWFYMGTSANESFSKLMEGSTSLFLVASITSSVVFMILGSIFGLIVVFLNQVIFQEYFPGLPQTVYKNILVILSGLFALALQTILLVGRISIPFVIPIAIALAITARAYADWYWTEERKSKNKGLRKMKQLDDNPFI